jgi:pimeloyl-ACP methyl ester carboxylesterase
MIGVLKERHQSGVIRERNVKTRNWTRRISSAALLAAIGGSAFAQQAAPAAGTLLGTNCNAPPIYHCPDAACEGSVVTQPGNTVEMKTRRTYFLDCPAGYKPGDKVNLVLSLHGGGSYANWQRNYAPFMDVKDKYKLVIMTPGSPVRAWSAADDEYLKNIVDSVVGTVGKNNVERFILAGHSQGGATSSRIICTDYFKDKVDVRISLSGGRVGPTVASGRGFGTGGQPVYQQIPGQPPPAPAARGPGGAGADASGRGVRLLLHLYGRRI